MIQDNTKKYGLIRYNKKTIVKAYFNGKLVYLRDNNISSLISSGIWSNTELWNNNDLFKN